MINITDYNLVLQFKKEDQTFFTFAKLLPNAFFNKTQAKKKVILNFHFNALQNLPFLTLLE